MTVWRRSLGKGQNQRASLTSEAENEHRGCKGEASELFPEKEGREREAPVRAGVGEGGVAQCGGGQGGGHGKESGFKGSVGSHWGFQTQERHYESIHSFHT